MIKLADNYYDSDDAIPNRSPPLKPQRVKLEPTPPPQSHVTCMVRHSNNGSSQMDAVLVSYMDPNQPDVTRAARDSPLGPIQDSGEAEVDMDGPDGISLIGERECDRGGKSGAEDPDVPEVDIDSPNDILLIEGREDGIASKSSSEDLVNTAQNALHTMAGHLTGVSLDPCIVGHSPQNPRASSGADVAGNLNVREAHVEPGRGNDPSKVAARSELTRMDSDSRISGDAVDALVSLRERSPKASQSEAHTHVEGHAQHKDNLGAMPSISGQPNSPASATDKTPPHILPTISLNCSPTRQLKAIVPQTDKPNLPPLRSHLNQLAEVAEKESVQSLDGRNGTAPLPALVAAHGPSPPPPPMGSARHDLPRIPLQYMTTQQRQQVIQAQRTNSPYPLSRMSPVSSHDETSPQDPFRRSREVTGSSPSPEPNHHTGSHPYYYNRRPSHTSEKVPPYVPTSISETPYPTPPTVDGGTLGEGFHRTPREASPDHQVNIDRTEQPLHRPTNGHSKGGLHRCPHPDCTAPPFQTQYLLNSHANVHSQVRPHYCPVKDCPRGVGGKGFKRKNELIRHGLVHASPGYICPFCSDKEHRYPRPDNLQRHVRVHHIDKHRDDPALRDVLSQRPEGGNRRRRSGH